MKYFVFGIGEEVRLKYSNEFIEKLDGFVDNDTEKQGKTFCGKYIYSPEILQEKRCFVIVSNIYRYHEVAKQLSDYGMIEGKDFVWGPDWYGNSDIPSTYGYKNWKDYDNTIDFSYGKWDYRVSTVASFINEDTKSVMDLGAGAMSLKKYIKKEVKYVPVDYTKRNKETLVCDFEEKEFPAIHVDCIVASGILEYMTDLTWFIKNMCLYSNTIIISYIPIEIMSDFAIRQHEGWKNNFTIIQLIKLFGENNFRVVDERRCIGNDLILIFEKAIAK